MNRLIVADTGPLIALARIESLPLLPALFSDVLLTPTVLAECEARPDRGEGQTIRAALAAGHMQLQAPARALPTLGLDAGETSAIGLALERGAGLLIDDQAGRRVAKRLELAVIGTAGVLVLAKRKGQIALVRPAVDALVASGYFLGPDVVAEVLRAAGETSP